MNNLILNLAQLYCGNEFMTVIEGVEHHDSVKGIAAERGGAAHKLSYIVGAYAATAWEHLSEVWIVPPSRWKGQLPDSVIDKRLLEDTGRTFRRHEAEAVALGMWFYQNRGKFL